MASNYYNGHIYTDADNTLAEQRRSGRVGGHYQSSTLGRHQDHRYSDNNGIQEIDYSTLNYRQGGRYRDDYRGHRRKASSRSNIDQSSNYIFGMQDFVSHNASHV